MSALASVLPFLASLKKVVPDASLGLADDGTGSMTNPSIDTNSALGPNSPVRTILAGSDPNAALGNAPFPTASPGPIAQQPVSQLPNLADPSMAPQASQVPEDKGNFFRQPYETKGHALLALLQRGLIGGLSGQAQAAQTYAQTGRSGGFGGGVAAGFTQALPFEKQMQALQLQHGGLTNEQLIQMLPFLRAQQFANLGKTQAETQNLTAQAGKATAETGAIPAETALKNAQAFAANYKEQNGILYNLQTGQPLTPDASGMVQTPADIAGAMGVKPGTKLPAKQITEARNAYYGHLNGSDPSIIAQIGPPPVNDRNALVQWGKQAEAIKTREASAPRIQMMLERPVQVADPNNPGNITYMPAGQAMQTGAMAPASAPAVTAKTTARELAPGGAVGKQTQAFNTSIQHADLLQQAVARLGNGDVQWLNQVKNSFNNQFGGSGPVTSQAIADAYTREVTKMLSAGHLTDSEIGTIGKTLDPQRQSPQQMLGVLQAYKALASSKLNVLQTGVQAGLAGRADFSGIQEPTATGPNGHKIAFRNGAWVDAATGQPAR